MGPYLCFSTAPAAAVAAAAALRACPSSCP
jgi:hypothetical protein